MYKQSADRGASEILEYLARTVPSLFDKENAETFKVSDIGCGDTAWAKAVLSLDEHLNFRSITYLGMDKHSGIRPHNRVERYVPLDDNFLPEKTFLEMYRRIDFELDQSMDSLYISRIGFGEAPDLTLFIEVYEHLSQGKGVQLLKYHLDSGVPILFSSAIPNQPGEGHITCDWLSNILQTLACSDTVFYVADVIRPVFWNSNTVDVWYMQNMVLLLPDSINTNVLEDLDKLRANTLWSKSDNFNLDVKSMDVVHPIAFDIILKEVLKCNQG